MKRVHIHHPPRAGLVELWFALFAMATGAVMLFLMFRQ